MPPAASLAAGQDDKMRAPLERVPEGELRSKKVPEVGFHHWTRSKPAQEASLLRIFNSIRGSKAAGVSKKYLFEFCQLCLLL
jgi:hypothetical protein